LKRASVPFLVGGAYGFAYFTGIERHTKDLDLFVRRRDCPKILETLSAAGFATEITFPHWLAKAYLGGDFIDIIFSSGNNIARVDDEWFEHAVEAHILGIPVRLCPVEEMIWSKAFVMERDRYDGADVAHLLRARGKSLDWRRLVNHFGSHWRVLFSHLILFEFIYPGEPAPAPPELLRDLMKAWEKTGGSPLAGTRVCQGTLLSATQYLADTEEWGYDDARLIPTGTLTREEIKEWSDAVAEQIRRG
jgi:hypothetical protein